jgi:hypothetical protein
MFITGRHIKTTIDWNTCTTKIRQTKCMFRGSQTGCMMLLHHYFWTKLSLLIGFKVNGYCLTNNSEYHSTGIPGTLHLFRCRNNIISAPT